MEPFSVVLKHQIYTIVTNRSSVEKELDHLIQEKIDVLFFSPTEHNMHIKNSLTLIEKLQPKYIMPQHHSTVVVNESTFFWAKGYQKEVRDKLSETLAKRYYILEPGDKVQID